MAFDGLFMHFIANDIKSAALGGRITQIYQPTREELIIALHTQGGSKRLLISAAASSGGIYFVSKTPENPPSPPMLCMLLRKRLGSGRLVDVRQYELDRVIFLDFECTNELGDKNIITVAAEIMGKHSNIVIIGEDGVIIDALKRVDITMSAKRLVLPALKYELPPLQDKLCLLDCSVNEVLDKACPSCEPLEKALLSTLQGSSPLICRELVHRMKIENKAANELNADEISRLTEQLARLKSALESGTASPCVLYKEDGVPFELAFTDITQYGSVVTKKPFTVCTEAAEEFFSSRSSGERARAKTAALNKLLVNLAERLSKKINLQTAELKKCREREQLRIFGDLLQANLYRLERGMSFAEVENFYDENYSSVKIPLDPAKSPAQNAQRYYKEYQKAKNGEQMLTEQIEKARLELEYVLSVTDSLSRAEGERDVAQIRLELISQGYIKPQKGRQKPPAALPPIEFTSSDGFKILVGRNNVQNDRLTLKTAGKNDIWLHTKDIHGTHTVIFTEGKPVPDTTLYQAACLAAYHSKAKGGLNVPVDYTLARYVSKPGGAKPGMVIYVNNKTLYVPAEIPEDIKK